MTTLCAGMKSTFVRPAPWIATRMPVLAMTLTCSAKVRWPISCTHSNLRPVSFSTPATSSTFSSEREPMRVMSVTWRGGQSSLASASMPLSL